MPQIAGEGGHRSWSMTRDSEGHREYRIVFRVEVENPGLDGPHTALYFTPGLPQPGDPWLHNNDLDLWAHCKKDVQVAEVQVRQGEKVRYFDLTFRFSTKSDNICQDTAIEDPLLQPIRKSGGGVRYSQEATHDRFGRPLVSSSFEMLRGPQVEFDANRDQVRISHNVALLQHDLVTSMRDTVNAFTFWGYPPRCVKLSDFTWEEKYYGKCLVYYTRNYVFDISYRYNPITGLIESGFDRDVPDEGTKALSGRVNPSTGEYDLININGAAPSPNNPLHFVRYKDRRGENTRIFLNGFGIPAGIIVSGQGYFISIQNGNLNKPLTNSSFWIAYLGPVDGSDPLDWELGKVYKKGEAVMISAEPDPADNGMYLATTSTDFYPPDTPGDWVHLSTGYNVTGTYNAATNYLLGDITQAQAGSGRIHIEKFHESDFLLLGLPAIL